MRLLTLIQWLVRGRFGQLQPAFLAHVLQTRYGAHRPPWHVVIRDVWRFLGWLRSLDALPRRW